MWEDMPSIFPLSQLIEGTEARIVRLAGGIGFQRNLRARGIREGKIIKIVAKHPLRGPLVISIDGRETTIGRGMAGKIFVEPVYPKHNKIL